MVSSENPRWYPGKIPLKCPSKCSLKSWKSDKRNFSSHEPHSHSRMSIAIPKWLKISNQNHKASEKKKPAIIDRHVICEPITLEFVQRCSCVARFCSHQEDTARTQTPQQNVVRCGVLSSLWSTRIYGTNQTNVSWTIWITEDGKFEFAERKMIHILFFPFPSLDQGIGGFDADRKREKWELSLCNFNGPVYSSGEFSDAQFIC